MAVDLRKALPTWGQWSAWLPCTKPCDTGTQTRRRVCQNGVTCPGDATSTKICNVQACYGIWSAWTTWSLCSKPCAVGVQKRQRSCIGSGKCIDGPDAQSQVCNTKPCPVGQWNQWMAWGACTKTCVGGRRERKRICIGSPVSSSCPGLSTVSEACGVGVCGVTGAWQLWEMWSKCSVSCGSGAQERTRTCRGSCPVGLPTDAKSCSLKPCPLGRLGDVLNSPFDSSQVLGMVTDLLTGLLSGSGSGNLFSSLGHGNLLGGGSGGGLNFGQLLGPLMQSVPQGAGRSAGRSQAKISQILSQGLRNAINKVNKQRGK